MFKKGDHVISKSMATLYGEVIRIQEDGRYVVEWSYKNILGNTCVTTHKEREGNLILAEEQNKLSDDNPNRTFKRN